MTRLIDKTNRQDLLNVLSQYEEVDIVITNIHKILDDNVLKKFDGRLVNLHYSLLPAYGGLIGMKTVDVARTDSTKFIGATCHEVSEILDGGKIICQSCFPVDWELPDEEIKDLVFRSANLCLLNSILLRAEESLNVKQYSYKKVIFNPSLIFDNQNFTEDFWLALKS